MPDSIVNIILALVSALFGAGGIVAWKNAGTERRQVLAQTQNAHDQIMAEAHKITASTVVSALKDTVDEQRKHLVAVNEQLADLDRRLAQERELRDALEQRAELLEDKVADQARKIEAQNAKIIALENERAEWRRERDALKRRILELEGCK